MDTLIFGLTVALIGMAIVFAGLVVLIGLVKLLVLATGNIGKPKQEKKAAEPAPAPVAAPVAEAAAPAAGTDDELIAVITAAIAAMMDGDNSGFVVRRVRRVSNTPAWSKSGREEQVYSRF